MRRYEQVAFRTAYLITGDDAEAQDTAQEAFVRAYRSLARFDAQRPFRPWLLRIVSNLALNSRRAARRRHTMSERHERDVQMRGREPSPETAAERADDARRLRQAVSSLRPQEQTVLYLRYFLDASEEETATVIGRPVGTVKSRVHRALRKLRAVVEERYPDLLLASQAERLARRET